MKSDCFVSAGVGSNMMVLTDATGLSLSDASKSDTEQDNLQCVSPLDLQAAPERGYPPPTPTQALLPHIHAMKTRLWD